MHLFLCVCVYVCVCVWGGGGGGGGFIHIREMSGNFFFFKVRELSGNSVMCQGKMKLCKMSGKCQGILHFNLMKLECFIPMYLFCLIHKIFSSSTVREI